ncbi:MAG: MATE family efflux transporter [Planctomycetota bacterium]
MIETPEQPAQPGSGLLAVVSMSWPASLTMLNVTVVRFIDGLMVAGVGAAAVSAQFYGGICSFAPESFMIGLLGVVSTFVSQNLGARREPRCSQYAWAGIGVALVWAAMMMPLAAAADWGFGLLGYDESPQAAMYFRYMVLAAPLTLGARVLEQFFYGLHRPRVVLAASLVGNALNVALNYVLIFGKLGLPAMGLEGAALGTVLAWGVQLMILLAVFFAPSIHARYRTRRPNASWSQCRAILRVGWPAGVQLANDIFSWGVAIMVLVGQFGLADRAATTILMRYLGLSFMPAVGVGIATTALVGRAIGAGDPDLAKRRAREAVALAACWMGVCGLVFWLARGPLIALFLREVPPVGYSPDQLAALQEQILTIGGRILLLAAVFQIADAVGIVYTGALRGAGDTVWPMVATMITSWVVVVGGGVTIVSAWPEWGAAGPWIAATAYVFILGALVAWRFESGAWRSINLLGDTCMPRRSSPEAS